MEIRTRMAPSPTGEFHIGSMRTLLYNYAFAKKHDGKFILRIEDTDRARLVEGALERTLNVIKEYGFSWDEGPEEGGPHSPYIQSERLGIYGEKALRLVEEGHAYYCFCTSERLKKLREKQQKQKLRVTKYDRLCMNLSNSEVEEKIKNEEPYTIRLKVPDNETVNFKDFILDEISVPSKDLDDQVLLKSDGYPTYHLAVVVDDYLMGVTHIMRGIEWLPSTPKHILLYKAFGWELPVYAHLPNLKEMGSNKKLSKRSGSVSANEFLEDGYLPESLNNFLMFLGWNPGTEKEIYTLEEFIKDFSLERVQKTDLVSFDREKLLWFNGQYIRKMSLQELYDKLLEWSDKYGFNLVSAGSDRNYTIKVLSLVRERMKTLADFNNFTAYFFGKPEVDNELLVKYAKNEDRAKEILEAFSEDLQNIPDEKWTVGFVEEMCNQLLRKKNYKPKEAYMTLRIALTGREASPHIFDVLVVLGMKESLDRIAKSLSLF